jgi:hypothetical protein
MSGPKCSTCKHYDPAPIWRKGWCRNPLLYSPQQSHLVGEDDLDCERGMGNYWEAADSQRDAQFAEAMQILDRSPIVPLHLYDRDGLPIVSQSGRPVFAVSGSSDYRDEPPLDEPADAGRNQPPHGGDRQLQYYSEERYWTDYLRIILPILGVLIFLVLLYLWALAFLRDGDDTPGQQGAAPTVTLPVITADATDTPRVGATGTPRIVVTAPPIQPTQPGQAEEPTPTPEPAETPIEPSGEIFVGGQVRVANTAGEGANLRSEPTTDAGVIAVVLDGTVFDVIDGPVEALGFTWWNVSGEQGEGWIVENYLVATE